MKKNDLEFEIFDKSDQISKSRSNTRSDQKNLRLSDESNTDSPHRQSSSARVQHVQPTSAAMAMCAEQNKKKKPTDFDINEIN